MKRKNMAAALGPALALALASSLPAQTSQTVLFRAVLSSSIGNSGAADLVLHVVRDTPNHILSGSADFRLAYRFPNDEAVTGLGITNSAGGTTFLLATNITAASPVLATAGSGRIFRQVQVMPGNQAGLAVLSGLLANPGQYSIAVLTADQPAGAMRGPLQSASFAVLMAALNSSAGAGAATVIVSYTGAASAITSAEVALQLTYQFPAQVTFSGMRVYTGQSESGQIAVAAELMPGTPSAAGGAGVLTAPATQIDMTNPQAVQAVQDMLLGPTGFSVDVDTVENPSAPLAGQLRGTDFLAFPIPGFAGAGAASEIDLYTLREATGSVLAGTLIFDVNYRLAAGAQIAGMDIDGNVVAPGVSTDPSGSGNAYAVVGVGGGAGLVSLNGILADPEAHRLNLLAASAMSAPLAVNAGPPVVAAVIPIVEVKDLSTFAPGEIVEIWGTNLAPSVMSAWPGATLPSMLDGVSVTLGGQPGRLVYVSPFQVDAVFAFETPTGSQMLTLNNGNGASAPVSLNVAAVAPALYNLAFKNADFSQVTASNPAHANDVLVFYATGMGQSRPALVTGQTVPLGPPFFNTTAVTPLNVTIGGANAGVIYSIAAPPYIAGLYQIAVTMPSGLAPGGQPVVATSGGIQSNTVTIAVE